MPRQKRTFSNAQKVAVLRRHLLEKVPVSDLCEELQIGPNLFYLWQKQFFENGEAAFGRPQVQGDNVWQKKAADLEAKLQRKHEVLSELMEEHLHLKKELGES